MIETAVVMLAGIFLAYRLGLIKLGQTAVNELNSFTGEELKTWGIQSQEKRSRRLGKVAKKLQDQSIDRSTVKECKKLLKELSAIEAE